MRQTEYCACEWTGTVSGTVLVKQTALPNGRGRSAARPRPARARALRRGARAGERVGGRARGGRLGVWRADRLQHRVRGAARVLEGGHVLRDQQRDDELRVSHGHHARGLAHAECQRPVVVAAGDEPRRLRARAAPVGRPGDGRLECVRKRSYPNALNEELGDPDAAPGEDHRRWCGKWIDARSVAMGTERWAFFDEQHVADDVDDVLLAKGSGRLGVSDVAKFSRGVPVDGVQLGRRGGRARTCTWRSGSTPSASRRSRARSRRWATWRRTFATRRRRRG